MTSHLDNGLDNGCTLVIGPMFLAVLLFLVGVVSLWPHPTFCNCSSIMLTVVSALLLCILSLSEVVQRIGYPYTVC